MKNIQETLDAIETEIESIEMKLQAESAYNVRWDLINSLEEKKEERRVLISQVYMDTTEGMP